jgi:transcriptional regulator with XRE-family HTH domain
MEQLPDRIRKIREVYGLTQRNIAERMNISSSTYGKMERNANLAKVGTLIKIANAIGVSLLFLLDTQNKNYKE